MNVAPCFLSDTGGSTHLWNVRLLPRDYTTLHGRKLASYPCKCLLVCCSLQSRRKLPTFQGRLIPQTSLLKRCLSILLPPSTDYPEYFCGSIETSFQRPLFISCSLKLPANKTRSALNTAAALCVLSCSMKSGNEIQCDQDGVHSDH
jgi:hypothetical protein